MTRRSPIGVVHVPAIAAGAPAWAETVVKSNDQRTRR